MRTSILSRSVIAVASLAIGSAALAATPATAATPSGITRDQVLTLVNDIRTAEANGAQSSEAWDTAIEKLVPGVCNFQASADNQISSSELRLVVPGQADGLLITVYLQELPDPEGDYTYRTCSFGLLVATDAASSLSGDATLAMLAPAPIEEAQTFGIAEAIAAPPAPVTSKLSGDVSLTVLNVPEWYIPNDGVRFSAAGNATKSVQVATTKKIWDKKAKSEKKYAKKKYDRRVGLAKKSYVKALKKAGNSTTQKAAAKQVYTAQLTKHKRNYKLAVWNYRYVKGVGTKTQSIPFKVTARTKSIFPA